MVEVRIMSVEMARAHSIETLKTEERTSKVQITKIPPELDAARLVSSCDRIFREDHALSSFGHRKANLAGPDLSIC